MLQLCSLALLAATCAAIACMFRQYMHDEVMRPLQPVQLQGLAHRMDAVSGSGRRHASTNANQEHFAIRPITCPASKPLLPIKTRGHIGLLLHEEGLKIGAELGVQAGQFAAEILNSWHSCTR
jgi:hypothetical protein